MNVRLYDAGVENMAALEAALRDRGFSGGTIRDTSMSAIIDVSVFHIFHRETHSLSNSGNKLDSC